MKLFIANGLINRSKTIWLRCSTTICGAMWKDLWANNSFACDHVHRRLRAKTPIVNFETEEIKKERKKKNAFNRARHTTTPCDYYVSFHLFSLLSNSIECVCVCVHAFLFCITTQILSPVINNEKQQWLKIKEKVQLVLFTVCAFSFSTFFVSNKLKRHQNDAAYVTQ